MGAKKDRASAPQPVGTPQYVPAPVDGARTQVQQMMERERLNAANKQREYDAELAAYAQAERGTQGAPAQRPVGGRRIQRFRFQGY